MEAKQGSMSYLIVALTGLATGALLVIATIAACQNEQRSLDELLTDPFNCAAAEQRAARLRLEVLRNQQQIYELQRQLNP